MICLNGRCGTLFRRSGGWSTSWRSGMASSPGYPPQSWFQCADEWHRGVSLVKSPVEMEDLACRWQKLWAFCGHCGRRILVTVSPLTV